MATTCSNEADGFVRCQKAGEQDAWDTEALVAHLAARGVPIGPGGAGAGEDESGPFVRLHLPDGYDPTADIDAFTPAPNPYLAAVSYLKRRGRTIRAKTPAQRQAATLNENDLLALLTVFRADQ
jgi:hypothetical protein